MRNARMNWLGTCVLVTAMVAPQTSTVSAANAALGPSSSQKHYRYSDDKGVVVIDDAVPPQFSDYGYVILKSSGQVLEVVPRQLTAAELANLSDEEKAKRDAKAREEKQQLYDESLLLRYSDVTDIEAARERGLKELQIRLSIVR